MLSIVDNFVFCVQEETQINEATLVVGSKKGIEPDACYANS